MLGRRSGSAREDARFCSRLARGSLGNRSILLELARACSMALLDCCSIFARFFYARACLPSVFPERFSSGFRASQKYRASPRVLSMQIDMLKLSFSSVFRAFGRVSAERLCRAFYGWDLSSVFAEQKSSNNRASSSKLEQARAKSSDFRASLERASSKIERCPSVARAASRASSRASAEHN